MQLYLGKNEKSLREIGSVVRVDNTHVFIYNDCLKMIAARRQTTRACCTDRMTAPAKVEKRNLIVFLHFFSSGGFKTTAKSRLLKKCSEAKRG